MSMELTDAEIATIAQACERCEIAPGKLIKMAEKYDPEIERLARPFLTDAEPRRAIAVFALGRFNSRSRAYSYTQDLYREVDWDNDFKRVTGPILADVYRRETGGHEAFLYTRDNALPARQFSATLEETIPRICMLWGDYNQEPVIGTGFLIGPDTVLTTMHLFRKIAAEDLEAEVLGRFKAIFDFTGGTFNSTAPAASDVGRRVVGFSEHGWLLAHSPHFEDEGTVADDDHAYITGARKALDYAIIKLAEPVGGERVEGKGVRTRGWIKVNRPGPADYDADAKFAVWQHPKGLPLHFDFGRVVRTRSCGSRLVYKEASTAPGSSGGPCVGVNAGLVGHHVAAYMPNEIAEANLAIRLDAVYDAIRQYSNNQAQPGPSRPWKVDQADGSIVPIIGRNVLVDWLMNALAKEPEEQRRAERLYTAILTSSENDAGLSFSGEIAQSILAGRTKDPVIVLGDSDRALPEKPEDFALMLGAELGIAEDDLKHAPPRPTAGLPGGTEGGDKLHDWASNSLPRWFLGCVVDTCRDSNRQQGRWDRAWIILDNLHTQPMSPLVQNFVAALIGANREEPSVNRILRRLQWLFLGEKPRFLRSQETKLEVIDSNDIREDEVRRVLEAVVHERGINDPGLVDQRVETVVQMTKLLTADPQAQTSKAAIAQNLLARVIEQLPSRAEAA